MRSERITDQSTFQITQQHQKMKMKRREGDQLPKEVQILLS